MKFYFSIGLEYILTDVVSVIKWRYDLPIVKLVLQIFLADYFTNVTIVMNRKDAPPFVKFDVQIEARRPNYNRNKSM